MIEVRVVSRMQEGDAAWVGTLKDPCAQASIWCVSRMSDVKTYSRMNSEVRCVSRMKEVNQ